jgi:hypothetical protein
VDHTGAGDLSVAGTGKAFVGTGDRHIAATTTPVVIAATVA